MAATDVISLDEALEAINMTGSGADHGIELQLFVSAVSERLDALCGPIVIREITDELYDVTGPLIFLKSWPVVEVTEVTEYASGTGTLLTEEAVGTSGDFLHRNGILSRRSGFSNTLWSGSQVVVTYAAGRYETTDDVSAKFRLAACEIIAREWPQYAASWSRGGDPFGGGLEGGPSYFKSVDPVVNQWLADELLPPAIA